MRRKTLAAASLALGVLFACPSDAEDELPAAERYVVRLEYLFWSPQPSGQLQKGLGDAEGTLLEAEADLGLREGHSNAIRGALRLGGKWKVRASWSPLEFRGDVTAGRAFVYGTTVVRSGDRVLTSLLGNYFTGELEWDFLENPRGFLGLLVGAKYFDVDAALVNGATSSRVLETERLPIPVLGLAGRAYLHRHFSLEGELSGLTVGDRGHVLELLLSARVHVVDRFALTGGYRKLVFEGRDNRDFFHLDLGTWTFGAELSL